MTILSVPSSFPLRGSSPSWGFGGHRFWGAGVARGVLSALFLALVLLSSPVLAANGEASPDQRIIRVTGSGEVAVTPDRATIRVGIRSEDESAKAALAQSRDIMADIFSTLEKAGIPRNAMSTENLSLMPVWEQNRHNGGEQRITGFAAVNVLRIRSDDIRGLGALLDSLTKAGANTIHGISFDVSGEEDYMMTARQAAVKNARARASAYAEAAGARLGRVLSISEHGAPQPLYRSSFRLEAADGGAVPIAEGENILSASVTMEFALE